MQYLGVTALMDLLWNIATVTLVYTLTLACKLKNILSEVA